MNPYKGLKGLPKNVWLISIGSIINRAGTMVLPFLALYLTQGLNYSVSESGIVIASYGIGSLICAPLAGRLSDKIGSLKLMKYSLLLSGGVFLLYSFVTSYYLLIVISIVLAIISESFRPASMAFISDQTTPKQRKTAFALYRLAINAGMSIGPVAGGFLSAIDFHLLFYFNAAAAIGSSAFFFFSKWDEQNVDSVSAGSNIGIEIKSTNVLKDFRLIYFLPAFLPVLIVFFQILSTIPLYIVTELEFSKSTFGILLAVNTILIIFIEVPLNTAMNDWDDIKSLFFGCILTAVGFGAMAFSRDIFSLVVSITIWTFGEMIIFPASSSYISNIAAKGKTGEYMGYYQMNAALSFLLAPAIGTWVLDSFGSFNLWIASFVLSLISGFALMANKKLSINSK